MSNGLGWLLCGGGSQGRVALTCRLMVMVKEQSRGLLLLLCHPTLLVGGGRGSCGGGIWCVLLIQMGAW